jgi:hypothetical protein
LHETQRATTGTIRHVVVLEDPNDQADRGRNQGNPGNPAGPDVDMSAWVRRAAGRVRLALAAALTAGLATQRGSEAALLNPAAWAVTHARAVQVGGLRLEDGVAPACLEERKAASPGTSWLIHAWPIGASQHACSRLRTHPQDVEGRLANAQAVILTVASDALTDAAAAQRVCDRIEQLEGLVGRDRLWVCFRDADLVRHRFFHDSVLRADAGQQHMADVSKLVAEIAVQAIRARARGERWPEPAPKAVVLWPLPPASGGAYWPFREDWRWVHAGLDPWVRHELAADEADDRPGADALPADASPADASNAVDA